MKNVAFFVVCVFLCISSAFSLDATGIEALRLSSQNTGNQLSNSDISLISSFWTSALDQMLLANTSVEMVEIRRQLEVQKGKENLSFFSTAYVSQAKESIGTAFNNSQRLEDPKQRDLVQRNLMILVGNLKNIKLIPIAMERLDSEDDVIRYWAFKTITQSAIIQQLTSDVTADETLVQTILDAIKQRIETESQNQIIEMAVNFCMAFDNPTAREILLGLKEKRAEAYRSWNIGNTSVDARLLTALGNIAMIQQDAEIKAEFGRAFAELFSFVMQRYIMSMEGDPDDQVTQLQNIIAIVDQDVLDKVMSLRTDLVDGMRRTNLATIKREYEALFGDRLRAGQLGTLLKFNYGTDSTGKAITTPPVLGPITTEENQ